ncbi:MAG: YebC/PmpR family DNA-binding transcriptional regulator, partial [Dysgonamonadaceae bacterium]|nr:YebC/PmpR family DNA-binding transcriptional regulator [Dysgonamonadaceae bacterium]
RSYFNKYGGSLGTSGSVEFMFDRKCVFKAKAKEGLNLDDLELELIDFGGEEVFAEGDEIMIYGSFEAYGAIQKYIEEHGLELASGGFERIPTVELKELGADQKAELEKLIEKFEEDDDVQNVYHTMK